MSDFPAVIDAYLAAWNEDDAAERGRLVAAIFAADATYTDPLAEVSGPDAIAALIGAVREQFPGMVFRLAAPIDQHHDLARFTWHLAPPAAAEPVVIGFDVARRDADGRIATVAGFLDKVPQG